MKLYKFKSIHGDGLFDALDMIVNEQIFLSTCESMNDINEGHWNFAGNFAGNYDGKLAKDLREIIDSQRFTCFVEKINHPLMWAHYAGGFSGIALEYEIDETKYDLRKIDYIGTPLLSKEQIEKVISGELLPQDIGLLKQKDNCWKYEDEWRLYGNGENKYIHSKPRAVIFGARHTKSDDLLRTLTKKFDIRVGYMIQESGTKFTVEYADNY